MTSSLNQSSVRHAMNVKVVDLDISDVTCAIHKGEMAKKSLLHVFARITLDKKFLFFVDNLDELNLFLLIRVC
jgi:hypothetical protein